MNIKFKKLGNVPTPYCATQGSGGFDLVANIDEPLVLEPHVPVMVGTGIAIEPENFGCVVLMFSRSGHGKRGISLANSVAVIDSDYRGEIKALLINQSNEPQTIIPGERIVQLVFLNLLPVNLVETNVLTETVRNDGGFGHSGKE